MGDVNPAITLSNVTISYARHPAVHHISGVFARGSLTAITGPNGGGKSTLLKAITGLIAVGEGEIILAPDMVGRIAYLPQAGSLQRDFPLSVLHLVSTGYWYITGGGAVINAEMQSRAIKALAEVGLQGFEKRDLMSLSSGQFQRVLFARLLVQDAPLIILDEPFTAMDAQTTDQLLNMVVRWHDEGRTVLCVLHDVGQIRAYFPQCLLLARECAAWGESAEVLKPDRLTNLRFFREQWGSIPEVCEQAV